MNKTQKLYQEAKRIIPGGTQLFSKRPEIFLPDYWPAYYSKASGCDVWDLDGKHYWDFSSMGIGTCILGYANKEVNAAVKAAIDQGSMSTLNCPEEVALAKLLCKLHPCGEQVRYARTGGEAMSIAVRIARAKTQKEKILFCGYHGWHDWYLSANLKTHKALNGHLMTGLDPLGVPESLRNSAAPFNYNDIDTLLKLVKDLKGRVAAIVMEPIRNDYPKDHFLEKVRKIANKEKIVLIFDEITSGWRLSLGGAHLNFDVDPDMTVFAKGMSNGFPMAAIIGKSKIMQAAQDSFISSTYWTERIGPVAALETIKILKRDKVAKRLQTIGEKIKDGWKKASEKHKLNISIKGIAPLPHFAFQGKEPLVAKTVFTQEMLKRKFLASTSFYASVAHTDLLIEKYFKAVDKVFYSIARATQKGHLRKMLKGQVCHSAFKRLN